MKGGKKPNLVQRPQPGQYGGVRRAEVKQEVDRRTWADLARAGFNVHVTGAGEYLTTEPVMFGQAFEEPPFFTFSAVGAVPEGGAEVKAIGWPAAAPGSEIPCWQIESLTTPGANVLRDPGFEDYVGIAGSSSLATVNEDDIPGYTLDLLDGSGVIADDVGWFGMDPAMGTQWTVANTGAESGTYALQCVNQEANGVAALGARICPVSRDLNWCSGIGEEGTSVTFSVRAMRTTSAGGNKELHLFIDSYDALGNSSDGALTIAVTTASFATYSVNYTLQAGERYFLARMRTVGSGSTTWTIDNCVLAVA